MFFFFNQKYCSRTQGDTSSPSPLPLPQREGSDMRDTPCGSQIFPLIITQANCFLHSSSLQERGQGGEAFLLLCKKGRRKIIFYIFPFYLYSFLSPPSFNSPLHTYPQGYCCICPSLRGEEELERASWVTLYITVLHRLDGCYAYYSC